MSTNTASPPKQRHTEPYQLYIYAVSATGLLIVLLSFVSTLQIRTPLLFLLLAGLSILAAFNTTSVEISNKAGITYAVGGAVSLASIPMFGVGGAAMLVLIHNIFLWRIKPAEDKTWKRNISQLAFNVGMQLIAVVCAALLLLRLQAFLGETTVLGRTLPWLVSALTDNLVNIGLLSMVLRLQHGHNFKIGEFLKSNRWAIYTSTLMFGIGGGLIAFAIANYGWLGIAIFFLPTFLSAYAFRLYVRQMQAHMENLEQIVAERTEELRAKTISLEEKTAELSALNKQKDAYLAVLTHDMMTPLSSIQLCTEILSDDASLKEENRRLSELILRSGKMLFGMVRNILDIEKLRVGEPITVHKTSCDVSRVLEQTVQMLQPEASERGVNLQSETSEQAVSLLADRQQIERILFNVVGNAIKYTPEGGSVWVRLNLTERNIVIDIEDTGYGIPAEELPYIFERFRRVEQLADKVTGTGLGLAITKALVEEHAGTISVTSEEGRGSLFKIMLPRVKQLGQ